MAWEEPWQSTQWPNTIRAHTCKVGRHTSVEQDSFNVDANWCNAELLHQCLCSLIGHKVALATKRHPEKRSCSTKTYTWMPVLAGNRLDTTKTLPQVRQAHAEIVVVEIVVLEISLVPRLIITGVSQLVGVEHGVA